MVRGMTRLRVESAFYEQAVALRSEFEAKIGLALHAQPAAPLLSYTYWPDAFQCLTASADEIFTRDLRLGFLDRLRSWALENIAMQHASSPFVRVYVDGCARAVVCDNVKAKWHYLLCLTQSSKARSARVKVIVESIRESANGGIAIGAGRLLSAKLEFNDLLVHEVLQPYGIEVSKTSMNPVEGAIFLDGYLW